MGHEVFTYIAVFSLLGCFALSSMRCYKLSKRLSRLRMHIKIECVGCPLQKTIEENDK